ncbi:hypothetical protein NW754_004443 [Fusarium falciforme]|uniref:Hypothetical protein n=1 Tax=Fusarium falciforme TaxID=195108 RepID=UPI002301B388|nr:Hypothetical protein NCS54_00375500 [Fusarium falciforme]KAJ4152647.1 hypothetical protein NW754_004443 [Fusarium falciforme]KAJ4253648.1 hypothetical protein NW757_005601 [Fusarium falciforme]WAO86479.1 Hypothetical protein NCS54_00375500 [Fusarium falciforme]
MYGKYIDPFATPTPCNCAAEHQAQVQCPHHGCCFLTTKVVPCSHTNCTQTYDIHRYERPPRQQQIWGINPIFYTQPGDDWESIEYVDIAIFSTNMPPQVIDLADEFKELLDDLIIKGRDIASKHENLARVLTETDDKRKLHAKQHCIACSGKNWVCPVAQDIEGEEQVAANLRSEGLTLSFEFKRIWTDVNNRVVRHMVMEQVNEIFRLRGIT